MLGKEEKIKTGITESNWPVAFMIKQNSIGLQVCEWGCCFIFFIFISTI